jgi:hypothetical protein
VKAKEIKDIKAQLRPGVEVLHEQARRALCCTSFLARVESLKPKAENGVDYDSSLTFNFELISSLTPACRQAGLGHFERNHFKQDPYY